MCVTVQSVRGITWPVDLFDPFPDGFISQLVSTICTNRHDLVADTAVKTRLDIIRYEVAHSLWMLLNAPKGGQMLGQVTNESITRAGSTTTQGYAAIFGQVQSIADSYKLSHFGRQWWALWSALPGWPV